MQLEARKLLYDIQQATGHLRAFTEGKSLVDYEQDPLLRSGVERQFEVAGEAIRQLAKVDEATAKRLSEYQRIIAFRNILTHGYAEVDNRLVWDILQTKLQTLHDEVTSLLESE